MHTDRGDAPSSEDAKVVDLLRAHGREALQPSPEAVQRMRAAILVDAQREATGSSFEAPDKRLVWVADAPAPVRPARLNLPHLAGRRRAASILAGLGLAATITAGTVLAQSDAGGVLYGPRIWVEAVTLPDEPIARVEAQMRRLDARADDLLRAASRDDPPAAREAAEAYGVILNEATADVHGEPTRLAALSGAILQQREELKSLVRRTPEHIRPIVAGAIDAAGTALERLKVPSATPRAAPVGRKSRAHHTV